MTLLEFLQDTLIVMPSGPEFQRILRYYSVLSRHRSNDNKVGVRVDGVLPDHIYTCIQALDLFLREKINPQESVANIEFYADLFFELCAVFGETTESYKEECIRRGIEHQTVVYND